MADINTQQAFNQDDVVKFKSLLQSWIEPQRAKALIQKSKWITPAWYEEPKTPFIRKSEELFKEAWQSWEIASKKIEEWEYLEWAKEVWKTALKWIWWISNWVSEKAVEYAWKLWAKAWLKFEEMKGTISPEEWKRIYQEIVSDPEFFWQDEQTKANIINTASSVLIPVWTYWALSKWAWTLWKLWAWALAWWVWSTLWEIQLEWELPTMWELATWAWIWAIIPWAWILASKGIEKLTQAKSVWLLWRAFKWAELKWDIPESAFATKSIDEAEKSILPWVKVETETWITDDLRKALRPLKEKRISEVEAVDNRLRRWTAVIIQEWYKPENLRQWADAISKSKKSVYSKYSQALKEAWKWEWIIPSQSIAEDFDIIAQEYIQKWAVDDVQKVNKMIQDFTNPWWKTRDLVSLEDANWFLQTVIWPRMWVLLRQWWWTASAEYQLLKSVSNKINNTIDAIVETSWWPKFSELKKDYAALKTLENSIAWRIWISERQAPFNLVDQITLINQAMSAWDPVSFLKNAWINLALKKIKELNSPDHLFMRAVDEMEKELIKWKWPKTWVWEMKKTIQE